MHLRDLRVRNAQPVAPRVLLQQALVDELLENRVAHLRVVEHCRIEIAPELLPHAVLLLADRLGEFLLRYRLPGYGRDVLAAARVAEIVVDAEEGEGQRDQREDELDDALSAVHEIEHGRDPGGATQPKKGELTFALRNVIGGVDGTRTRDPRRDRPVF